MQLLLRGGLRPSARPSIRIFEPGVVPSIIFACTQQHKYSLPKWLRDENKHKALTKHPCRTRPGAGVCKLPLRRPRAFKFQRFRVYRV